MALTGKQRAFIEAYLSNGFNGTRAAIAAGYSKKTAHEIARQNLKKVDIATAITERLKAATISADEAIQRLSEQAVGDLGDYIYEDGTFDLERCRADGKTHLIKEFTFNETFNEKSDTRYTRTSIKLHDAQSALKEIIKLYRLDDDKPTDRIDITSELSDDERMARIAAIFERARDRRNRELDK